MPDEQKTAPFYNASNWCSFLTKQWGKAATTSTKELHGVSGKMCVCVSESERETEIGIELKYNAGRRMVSSVTRWLEYFSIFGHLQHSEDAQKQNLFTKVC